MRSLGWDDLQYGQYQESKGLEWLRGYCGDDEEVIGHYAKHPLFWKWYRNHWHARDMVFLANTKRMSVAEKITHYHNAHNMKGFRYKPHRVIMERTMYEAVIYPATHEQEVTA